MYFHRILCCEGHRAYRSLNIMLFCLSNNFVMKTVTSHQIYKNIPKFKNFHYICIAVVTSKKETPNLLFHYNNYILRECFNFSVFCDQLPMMMLIFFYLNNIICKMDKTPGWMPLISLLLLFVELVIQKWWCWCIYREIQCAFLWKAFKK